MSAAHHPIARGKSGMSVQLTSGQVARACAWFGVAAVAIALGQAPAAPSTAQTTSPQVVARAAIGGPIVAVAAVGGDLAWVGAGATVSLYDISSAAYPERLSHVQLDPGANVRSLAAGVVDGARRVYAGTDRGLYVVPAQGTPEHLSPIATYGPVSGVAAASAQCRGDPTCWELNEHRLFLADADFGVLVADTAIDPPLIVAGFPIAEGASGSMAFGFAADGQPPYVLVAGQSLTVLIAGETVAPAADMDLGGQVVGVAAVGSLGFASVVGVGLVVLDLGDPSNPAGLTTLAGVPSGHLLASGDHVWIAGSEIRLLRLESGSRPVDIFGGPGPYLGISAASAATLTDKGLLAAAGDHLSVVDMSGAAGQPPGPEHPRELSKVPALWPMLSIASVADHVLVAKGIAGLDIVAMEGTPDVAISYLPSAGVFGVAVDGATAFLSTGAGAQVLHVGQPDQPALGTTFGPDWPPTAWLAADSAAVVAAYSDAVRVADRSGGALVDAGVLLFADLPDWPPEAVVQGVALVPGAAYLAAGFGGVVVVDLQDPARPRIGRRLQVDGAVTAVAAEGHRLGAATADGWAVFDVTQPLAPELVERVKTSVAAHDLAFDGDLLWVADDEGVRLRDLTEPGLERRFVAARPAKSVVAARQGAIAEVGTVLYSLVSAEEPVTTPTPTASAVPTGWPSPGTPSETATATMEPTPTDPGPTMQTPTEPADTRRVYLPQLATTRP